MGANVSSSHAIFEEIAIRASTPLERSTWNGNDTMETRESEDEIQARIERLTTLIGITDEEQIQQFFTQYHLDPQRPEHFLSSPMQRIGPLPGWIEVLEHVVRQEVSDTSPDRCIQVDDPLPFEEVLLPFVLEARHQYEQRTATSPLLLDEPVQATLERRLLRNLSHIAGNILLHEFAQFRKQYALWGILSERKAIYGLFLAQYRGEGLLFFFQEYSVLARLLVLKVEQWVDVSIEFVQRLASDRDDLEKTFHNGQPMGPVVTVQPERSDSHHQGHTVCFVTFKQGVKVVYKPRCLNGDQTFADLLLWGNAHGLSPSLKPIRVVSRATHGWAEYITQQSCTSRQEVQTYYLRAGMLLCWLYVLGGGDMHNENLIASGEYPMLVDLETVITPGFPPCLYYKKPWKNALTSDDLLCMRHLVLHGSFLPALRWLEKSNMVYDNSGLGGGQEHLPTISRQSWKHINTDAMDCEILQRPGSMSSNTVLLQDVAVNPLEYNEEILKGFRTMYHFLIEHRNELLAPGGLLNAFAGSPLRFVRQDTQTYGEALEMLAHPAFLRTGTDRWIELQAFTTMILEGQNHPALWKIAESEILSLQHLDIPWFGTLVESRDLWLETGEILPDIFPLSALEQARSCLVHFDEADLAQQSHIIRTAFLLAQSTRGMVQENLPPVAEERERHETLPVDELVEVAHQIGQQLCEYAYDDLSIQNDGTWIGLLYDDTLKGFRQDFVAFDLYRGASGIGLFLAALEKITQQHTFRDLIVSALEPLSRTLKDAASSPARSALAPWNIGGTNGLGSWMYALLRIGIWLDLPELLEAAWDTTRLLTEQRVQADKSFDVISGSAGALLGMLSLYAYQPKDELLQRALWCGQHLLRGRVETSNGARSWSTIEERPLTGFSHGAAGIAYALLRLAEATGDQDWKDAAQEAIAFEQSLFVPELGNWPDLREQSENVDALAQPCMTAWCHGATGIGLARLGGLPMLDTPQVRADLAIALQTTQEAGLQEIDALCCGNSGRIELLVAASQRLRHPHLLQVARHWSSELVRRSEERGGFRLFSQLPRQAYNPSLFQGTAGIGYEMLRVARPDQLPSVLLWE